MGPRRVGTPVSVGAAAWLLGTAAGETFTAVYDQTVQTGGEVIQARAMVKDDRFRMESTVQGKRTVILRRGAEAYSYLPEQGIAMRLPSLQPTQEPLQDPGAYERYLLQRHAQRGRSETVNGYPTDVYTFEDPQIGGYTTVWVWKGKRLPVRLRQRTPEGEALVEFSNIRLDADIPDEQFELPPNVQVIDASSPEDLQRVMELLQQPSDEPSAP